MALVRDAARVLRREGPGALWRAFALRFLRMQPVPRAFVPPPLFDTTDAELAANRAVVERFATMGPWRPTSANWYVPAFAGHPMAGLNNIFTAMRLLQERHNLRARIVMYGPLPRTLGEIRANLAQHYPTLGDVDLVHLAEDAPARAPPADLAIATRWDSCYHVLRQNDVAAKLYFVQDLEHLMYPAGTESALAEETYRFGFARVCNTPSTWLATREHGGPSTWIHQPVDARHNFPPARKPDGPVRVVFYGRPTNPRNGFGLGVEALRRVKARFGSKVEIVSMGEAWDPRDYGLEGIVANRGVMDLGSLGEAYRAAHVGLGLIFTRHPSLQPLEYWANGLAVVTNENPVNRWIFRDGENCLTSPPSPSQLAERIGRLVEDAALRERLARAGAQAVLRVRWEDEVDRIWAFVSRQPMPERPLELGASPIA